MCGVRSGRTRVAAALRPLTTVRPMRPARSHPQFWRITHFGVTNVTQHCVQLTTIVHTMRLKSAEQHTHPIVQSLSFKSSNPNDRLTRPFGCECASPSPLPPAMPRPYLRFVVFVVPPLRCRPSSPLLPRTVFGSVSISSALSAPRCQLACVTSVCSFAFVPRRSHL